MTAPLRIAGEPSPLAAGTHVDEALPPPIPFDPAATVPGLSSDTLAVIGDPLTLDPLEVAGAPRWLALSTRLIRPICVGALLAIPAVGAASVGLVAIVSGAAAQRMVSAGTGFLHGIPDSIVLLIGALAGGYTVAKTAEKLTGRSGPAS